MTKPSAMTNWNVTTTYKYDLASACNLFTRVGDLTSLHTEAYQALAPAIDARPELVELAQSMHASGFDPRLVLVSLLDLHDYMGADIDDLTGVLATAGFRERVRRYYVDDVGLVTSDVWAGFEPMIPLLSEMARYVHEAGFCDYWHIKCLPRLQSRCAELQEQAQAYPVVDAINAFLGRGFELPGSEVTLYLSMLSAPFGTSLRGQAFLSDQRWGIKTTVCIALHELMHPPFGRNLIGRIADELMQDPFFDAAFRGQRPSTPYNTPLRFLEENLVEAAHVYLAYSMGALDRPLDYFLEHDGGSHVVSAIIYDWLTTAGARESSYAQIVLAMVSHGPLTPGRLREEYERIYS